ncbi:MAG: hypothetical protein U0Q07_15780 [Acidimicrobiales bacterium]
MPSSLPPSPARVRHRRRGWASAAVLAASLTGVATSTACGSSGRTMATPIPGATAPPRATSSTVASTTTSPLFTLSSPAWTSGGRLPASAVCPGGTSPPLTWSNVPPGTAELALVLRELDGDRSVRWLVTGIAPSATSSPAGGVPAGATVRPNATGAADYAAPCPTEGSHPVDVELLALGVTSALPPDLPAADAAARLEQLAGTKRAALTGTVAADPSAAGTGGSAGTGSGRGSEVTTSTGPDGTGG